MKNYDDIISLPHHVSASHPHMPVSDRAAQFAPFAALTGYDDAIAETGRETQAERFADESLLAELNETLAEAVSRIAERPKLKVDFFIQDERKQGGEYRTYEGALTRLREGRLLFADGTEIALSRVIGLCLTENTSD